MEARKALPRATLAEALLAVETWVLSELHRKIFTGLSQLFNEEDTRVQGANKCPSLRSLTIAATAMIAQCQHLTMRDVGVRADLVVSPADAIKEFSQLNSHVTPLQKLACLKVSPIVRLWR